MERRRLKLEDGGEGVDWARRRGGGRLQRRYTSALHECFRLGSGDYVQMAEYFECFDLSELFFKSFPNVFSSQLVPDPAESRRSFI